MADFLLEILTEELPPASLKRMAEALNQNLLALLTEAHFTFQAGEILLATPRRLAVIIYDLAEMQPDQTIERTGPSTLAAFDKGGNPNPAALGFAKSCGVSVDELKRVRTNKGECLMFQKIEKGKSIFELLPEFIKRTIEKLPITKYMRWGESEIEFVRPVLSVMMLYSNQVVPADILGCKTGNVTQAHRTHAKDRLIIPSPKDYIKLLRKNFVMVDFNERQENIREQILKISKKYNGTAIIRETLLEEVTAATEWPVALLASFPKHFLELPREVLICSIEKHQRCFPLVDNKNNLLPNFITIANLNSSKPKKVIHGNERVMNARLSDAKFFYETDLKIPLDRHVESLKHVIFQAQLGSLWDKTKRLQIISKNLIQFISADINYVERAALLAKTDLMTQMVGEFPELQGIMGYYYALKNGEGEEIVMALKEHYLPKGAEDELPKSNTGIILAMADRIDTLVGLFGINKIPSGDKDPFALRRAALGILRIIVDKELSIDLGKIVQIAHENFPIKMQPKTVENVLLFMADRFIQWLLPQGFTKSQCAATMVSSTPWQNSPLSYYHRVKAVREFSKLPEAESLAAANKRVANILEKQASLRTDPSILTQRKIDVTLLQDQAEINLARIIAEKQEKAKDFMRRQNYTLLLMSLAELKEPIDQFFDKVMVMVQDDKICLNRLALLAKLRELFLKVADISLLQIEKT